MRRKFIGKFYRCSHGDIFRVLRYDSIGKYYRIRYLNGNCYGEEDGIYYNHLRASKELSADKIMVMEL